MRINTNISSLLARKATTSTNLRLSGSLEKLSSGLKINKAADDASGLAIADKLRTQTTSINQAISNGNSAIALLQIADKSMDEQSRILDTVKAKLIQANTDATSNEGRESIRKDIVKLLAQLDNIAKQTNYNGTNLLQGPASLQDLKTSARTVSSILTAARNTSNKATVTGSTSAAYYTGAKTTKANIDKAVDTALSTSTDPIAKAVGDAIKKATATSLKAITPATAKATSTQGILDSIKTSLTTASAALFTSIGSASTIEDVKKAIDTATSTVKNPIDKDIVNAFKLRFSSGGGPSDGLKFQVGENSLDIISTSTIQGNTRGLDLTSLAGLTKASSLTITLASNQQKKIDDAITKLNSYRGNIGSTQNQVESAVRNLSTMSINIKSAESVIRDVDYASESANFNKLNIIAQAGSYAISQANIVQQNVLKLLQ